MVSGREQKQKQEPSAAPWPPRGEADVVNPAIALASCQAVWGAEARAKPGDLPCWGRLRWLKPWGEGPEEGLAERGLQQLHGGHLELVAES